MPATLARARYMCDLARARYMCELICYIVELYLTIKALVARLR